MIIIKDVFFVDAQERARVSKSCKQDERDYLGMVATWACGRAISICTSGKNNYLPTSILSAICSYLERTRKNNKDVIYQDYNFYVYMYGLERFIEVETKEVVKITI